MTDKLDLLTQSYDFDLPESLIAQRPIDAINRDRSKLLVYKKATNEIIHSHFYELGNFLSENTTLVLNQSKVFPSRLIGNKLTGGKAEVFLLSPIKDENDEFEVLIKTRSKKNIGDVFIFPDNCQAKITKILDDGTFKVQFDQEINVNYLEKNAKIPIPPYIRKGESDEEDKKNYQTVYAGTTGSVAAPTAGLHFTDALFEKLAVKNISRAYVTLHVGIGTFRPVSVDNIKNHQMHFENFFVDQNNFEKIKKASKKIAVGTTSLRVLETLYQKNLGPNLMHSTNIFLHPGVDIKSIDGLITNFHLPKSSLIMLVAALLGREKTLELYREAIKHQYRFFSYGDAMLILL